MAKKKKTAKKAAKAKKVTTMDRALWRDPDGRFRQGNPGGPGRPFRREARFIHTISETVTDERWRKIVERAVLDAEQGERYARDWLSKWLLGAPEQFQPNEKRTIIDVLSDGNFIKWIEAKGGNHGA